VRRYNDTIDNRELILQSAGYSGTEEIYVGIYTYQNASADYYNLAVATFTGYVDDNTFTTQPGIRLSGVPAHNQRIDYWLNISPGRIAAALKVGTPVYESFYIGKFLPYARPSQYPYPVVCGGMLSGAALTRFSDTVHTMYVKGNRVNLGMRHVDGLYRQPEAYPWNNAELTGATAMLRNNPGGDYPLLPVELSDANGIYGWLEGIMMIPGFDNVVENTFTLDGIPYVVIQDVYRTAGADYYALALN
jgi:hypothetical protein